jgi:organic radical activating enzyme
MTYPINIVSTKPQDTLDISWDITNVCNFACHYCFPEANAGTHKVIDDIDLLVTNFTHLVTQYKTKLGKEKIHLKIGGGEPTLWKDFGELISKLKDNNNLYLSIISNASRTLRWWNEYGNLIDNAILSFHINSADINHHIAVADILTRLGKKVTVLVLMDSTRWNDCISAIEYMKVHSKERWFIEAKTVIGDTYTTEQTTYLLDEIKRMPSPMWFIKNIGLVADGIIRRHQSVATLDDGSKLNARSSAYISRGWNDFTGWKCNIGLESVYIKWTGEIKGACGQQLYGIDYTFNILDKDFIKKYNPEFKSAICNQSSCVCLPETHVTKSLS